MKNKLIEEFMKKLDFSYPYKTVNERDQIITELNLIAQSKPLNISAVSCRCLSVTEISKKRVQELQGLKKYARDQFTVGLIESQIKYWSELQ